MLINDTKVHDFKIDFLKVKFEYDMYLENLANQSSFLDSDNTNWSKIYYHDFEFILERSGDYFLIRPLDFPFSICRFSFGQYVTIDFYGAFFSWIDSSAFLSLFLDLPHRVLRCDLALDLIDVTPSDVQSWCDSELPLTTINNKQTIYIGSWRSNRKIVRIYDKKADIERKRKGELHHEILSIPGPVTRLEVELRSVACDSHGLTLSRLMDPHYQYEVFRTELQTRFLWFPLPLFATDFFARPVITRGEPEPVTRFKEACEKALKNNVDILEIVRAYYE